MQEEKEVTTVELVKILKEREEMFDHGKNRAKHEGEKMAWILFGAFLYAFGLNVFIQPLNFYAGGFTGVAQLITYGLAVAGIKLSHIDLTGILYYLLNVPAILMAVKSMRKRFIIRTIIAITMMTLLMTFIPIPHTIIFDDKLGSALVGGFLVGVGTGFILRSGACDGGINLVGMIMLNKSTGSTIGRISAVFNAVLYCICLFLFDAPTVIYSMIYSLVVSFACDRIHTQTIGSQAIILTKIDNPRKIEIEIMGRMGRGVTKIDANGAFTGENVTILMVYLSKFEVLRLRMLVKKIDPNAFIAVNNGIQVDGYFLRKLT